MELPDNEYSTNTTQSVSSILLTSQHRQQQKGSNSNSNMTTLAQLNPDYPVKEEHDETQDTVQRQDPFQGKVEHPQQHKLLAQSDFWPPHQSVQQNIDDNNNTLNGHNNQLTVGSMNQLTVNSINSMNTSSISAAQLDDYIQRLLDVGYASKVPKQLCLKTAEVNNICRAAMDIFLSQPVSLS
jgi:serine/threonine-protein phosphatase PP1 catalytic subunit